MNKQQTYRGTRVHHSPTAFGYETERGNYHTRLYLSSIQHKNLTPSRFVADSSKMTLSRVIWDLQN